jgi:hypothetical protein
VPHGDTHILWIDPKDPERFIHGNDGGATVSYDAGATWSSIYNQPTSQFYHVTADDQFPYRLYGAQQDNTTVSIASRSDEGAVTRQDWFRWPGARTLHRRQAVGSQRDLRRLLHGGALAARPAHQPVAQRVGVARQLRRLGGGDVPNRFAWTYPILYSPHDPKRLYISSQHVWT